MGWIIIAIGSIVSALGALIAYSGLDYVQLERGWTAIIAGTTLLSGGMVVVAIGFMTLQIGKLTRLLPSAAATVHPKPEKFAPELPLTASLPPDVPMTDSDIDLLGAKPAEAKAAEAPVMTATDPKASFESFIKASAHPQAIVQDLPEAKIPVEPKVTPVTAVTQVSAPVTKIPVIEPAPMATLTKEDLNSLDWLEEAISGIHEPQEPSILLRHPALTSFSSILIDEEIKAVIPEQAVAKPEMPKPEAVSTEALKPQLFEKPASEKPAPEKPASVKAEPQHFEPSVVGRYEAAGTSYAMYSDGSVEAENEHGIFRFASMAELRAFIEEGSDEQAPQDHQP
eukprot:gene9658-9722_t